jgi:hypothetical protein
MTSSTLAILTLEIRRWQKKRHVAASLQRHHDIQLRRELDCALRLRNREVRRLEDHLERLKLAENGAITSCISGSCDVTPSPVNGGSSNSSSGWSQRFMYGKPLAVQRNVSHSSTFTAAAAAAAATAKTVAGVKCISTVTVATGDANKVSTKNSSNRTLQQTFSQ